MIVYDPFWELIRQKKISQYTLITHYKISSKVLSRLKHNMTITSKTMDQLCEILDCRIEDICVYKKSSVQKSAE